MVAQGILFVGCGDHINQRTRVFCYPCRFSYNLLKTISSENIFYFWVVLSVQVVTDYIPRIMVSLFSSILMFRILFNLSLRSGSKYFDVFGGLQRICTSTGDDFFMNCSIHNPAKPLTSISSRRCHCR